MKPGLLLLIIVLISGGALTAQSQPATGIGRKALLQQLLPSTNIDEVRMDEIVLPPGLGAPVHYHPGEVYGYVVEGRILYQQEGEEPVTLKAGDGFREPAGKKILAFKNALADQSSKFIAVYLLRKGRPPIRYIEDQQKP